MKTFYNKIALLAIICFLSLNVIQAQSVNPPTTVGNSMVCPTISLDSITNVSCHGEDDGAIYLNVQSDTTLTYVWNTGATGNCSGGVQQTPALPPFTTNYQSATNTRGYWFTAPSDFTISGLKVPTDVGTDVQNIEVVKFTSGPPPTFSGTTSNFTSLLLVQGEADTGFVSTNIQIQAGDIIGILGARGTTTMNNSYAANNFVTTINGQPVTLQRLGYQGNLNSAAASNLFTENSSIARIEMKIGSPCNPSLDSLMAGTNYSITVTDADGCVVTGGNYTVTEPSAITISVDSITNVSCAGEDDGMIQLNIQNDSTLTYTWNTGATGNCAGGGGQTPALPSFTTNYQSATGTRGYWFTAPSGFTISGLKVPTDVGTDVQNIEVVKFTSGPPPTFSGTTNNFTSLLLVQGEADTGFVSTNIQVQAGDIIGILGARGTATMNNSYAANNFVTTINGQPVTLQRLGYQGNLNSAAASNLFTENSSIARIEMKIGDPCNPTIDSLMAGTNYSITVTDAYGCTATGGNYTITEPSVITSSAMMTSCSSGADGEITVTANGGTGSLQYSIDNGTTYQVSAMFTGLAAANYDVVVKDDNGCTTMAQTITVIACFSASITNTTDVTCPGGNDGSVEITVANGTAPYTVNGTQYSMSPFTITGLSDGAFSETVTDNTGSMASVSGTVSTTPDNIPPTVTTQDITINLDANGDASIIAGDIIATMSDNCGMPTGSVDITTFTDVDFGANTVTVTVTDNSGNTTTETAIVTVEFAVNTTNIQEKNITITAYPNPAHDFIRLVMTNINEPTVQATLLDINGRVISQNQLNSKDAQINVSALPQGNYIIRIQTEKAVKTVRFVKQ